MNDSTGSHNPNYSITMPRFTSRNCVGPLLSRRFRAGKRRGDPAPGWWAGARADQGRHQASVRENPQRAHLVRSEAACHVSCFGDSNNAFPVRGHAHKVRTAISHRDVSTCVVELDRRTLTAPTDISRYTRTGT